MQLVDQRIQTVDFLEGEALELVHHHIAITVHEAKVTLVAKLVVDHQLCPSRQRLTPANRGCHARPNRIVDLASPVADTLNRFD